MAYIDTMFVRHSGLRRPRTINGIEDAIMNGNPVRIPTHKCAELIEHLRSIFGVDILICGHYTDYATRENWTIIQRG